MRNLALMPGRFDWITSMSKAMPLFSGRERVFARFRAELGVWLWYP